MIYPSPARLREIGRTFGYSFSVMKTSTELHGIPQVGKYSVFIYSIHLQYSSTVFIYSIHLLFQLVRINTLEPYQCLQFTSFFTSFCIEKIFFDAPSGPYFFSAISFTPSITTTYLSSIYKPYLIPRGESVLFTSSGTPPLFLC